jgi:hypothetical protein
MPVSHGAVTQSSMPGPGDAGSPGLRASASALSLCCQAVSLSAGLLSSTPGPTRRGPARNRDAGTEYTPTLALWQYREKPQC